ncbi:BglII/BstYI family type II restriction endonuclease [Candidatus Formimonas warabiya]|uniref:Restriction endonuclease n=1 Tax=Formimonas warabiya TaxID=1761012 RepID=A0A3G1KQ49_FORW1|nr:BglII/BstYI family type II restriction endonuclease [Candidatus Formimonas warabiya]ATW24568.1 hypothetical protein DCMF_07015 [Candidatus Formimonas warabiya]
MKYKQLFYNCSPEYINSISPDLSNEVIGTILELPKRTRQSEINRDLFWLLGSRDWNYHSVPSGITETCPPELGLSLYKDQIVNGNKGELCATSTTVGADWHSDFAKDFSGNLVQIEIQFGKVDLMFKDFCGFRLAYYERRLSLGIEIVMSNPGKYFAHRKNAISRMAYFDIARKTLTAIGLNCPIWLIGIEE